MKKGTLEKFSVTTIKAAVSDSDLQLARSALCFAYGSMLDIGGKVQKVVKRGDECRLVIESDITGFIVFADCSGDVETVISRRIRKGSSVRLQGHFASFGAMSVCLSACRLVTS
jgi:hypothetical protein